MPEAQPNSADALVAHLRSRLAARAGDADEVLVHERAEPARAPSLGVLRPHLPPQLARAVVRQGVQQLYAHQVAAVEALRGGQNVVLASPTASGKSLAFALPTLERLLASPGRHALYLYPTKALIGDQLRALRELVSGLPIEVAVLTGDTPREERVAMAARPPSILLANPGHPAPPPLLDHRRWEAFLGGLDVVVLDRELHTAIAGCSARPWRWCCADCAGSARGTARGRPVRPRRRPSRTPSSWPSTWWASHSSRSK
jgi:DEAD/DEAH box helicase domain-containing protein